MIMKGKVAIASILLGFVILHSNLLISEVEACTQTDMYDTVKEAVENTYTEDSYEFAFVGENDEVTREDVEDVIGDITDDYSNLYEIDMQSIKECSDNDLKGYEVVIDVSSLEYQEKVAFEKKLNKTIKVLKKRCKGKSQKAKVKIVNKWCKKNIAVKSSAAKDFYNAYTTRTASREGYASVNAYLLCKMGVKARVVKYQKRYCTLVMIKGKSYLNY